MEADLSELNTSLPVHRQVSSIVSPATNVTLYELAKVSDNSTIDLVNT